MLHRLACIVALLGVPQVSAGQVYISAGTASPLAPESVTKIYRTGYTAAVGFALESGAYPFVRFRPFGTYQRFRTDPGPFEAQFENVEDVAGGDVSGIFAGADLQFRRPFAVFTPFITSAIGIAVFSTNSITADGITFTLRDEVTGFTLGIGGGFAYAFTRNYELFLEGQYVHTFLDGDERSFVPVRLGMEFGFDY